ncbi:MAG: type IV pilus assembly protein PilM [Candidatus Margulisiibacteriota bacterium]
MGLLSNKSKILIGLDISGGYVRMAQLKISEKDTLLENYAVVEVPQAKEGQDRISVLSSAIKEAAAGFSKDKNREVFAMTSGPDVSIRRVLLPKLSGKELAEAIKWETKTHFPFPVDKVVIDKYVMGPAQDKGIDKLDTWLVAAQKELLEKSWGLTEKAGLPIKGISVPPFAAWNLLRTEGQLKDSTVTVFINMGAEITGISFFDGQKLDFYRELSIAGNNITNAMVGLFVSDNWQMNINYEQAEKIKRQYGIPKEGTEEKTSDGVPLSNILQIMKPVLKRLMNDILRSFDYYKEQYNKTRIDRVIISGGSSKLLNLAEYLSSGLGIKVETLNKLVSIKVSDSIDAKQLEQDLSHLTTSIGLALSRAKEINLYSRKKEALSLSLPFDLERFIPALSLPSPSAKVPAIIASAVLAVFIAAALFTGYNLDKTISFYSKQLEEKKILLTDLKLLSERRAILSKIEKEQAPLRGILTELTNILPPSVTLSGVSYVNASKYLVISGSAPSVQSIGTLLKNIEGSSMFSKTILIEAKKSPSGAESLFNMTFAVDL